MQRKSHHGLHISTKPIKVPLLIREGISHEHKKPERIKVLMSNGKYLEYEEAPCNAGGIGNIHHAYSEEKAFFVKKIKESHIKAQSRLAGLTRNRDAGEKAKKEVSARIQQAMHNEALLFREVHGEESSFCFEDGIAIQKFSGFDLGSKEGKEYISKLSLKEKVNLVKKIAEAIVEIHKKCIGHFDIKPENCIYDPKTGKIYIIDFGTSKKLESPHPSFMVECVDGTPKYKSVEATIWGGAGYKSDLFALAIMIQDDFELSPEVFKEAKLDSEIIEYISVFFNRLKGKDIAGRFIGLDAENMPVVDKEIYLKEVYSKYRPIPEEAVIFLNNLSRLLSLSINNGISKWQSRHSLYSTEKMAYRYKTVMKKLAFPTSPGSLLSPDFFDFDDKQLKCPKKS
jgi:serine/threonine protein kinase